ncbi:MAG TPA: inorganic phosphate transporter [Anaerolineae bacterium]
MLPQLPAEAVALIALALAFDFLNGLHDSSNVVATMIASRAIGPRMALTIAAVAEAAGPFLFGVAVARTIGSEVVAEAAVKLPVLIAALIAAIGWNVITWFFGIPSSSSHALIGGIAGAAAAGYGLDALKWSGMAKVLIALFVSPPFGLLAGYLLMKTVRFLAQGATPRVNVSFKRGQLITAVALALSHGTNDAQKTMGIITLGLVAANVLPAFDVPVWVIALSAGAIALGTSLGGWRLIRTIGGRFYTIRPVHGFTAQAASAAVILGAALLGGPVSTTQVVSSSVVGAGSAERLSKVRWGVAQQIVVAWLLTLPMSALVGAVAYLLIRPV